jgi:hypothetical protein
MRYLSINWIHVISLTIVFLLISLAPANTPSLAVDLKSKVYELDELHNTFLTTRDLTLIETFQNQRDQFENQVQALALTASTDANRIITSNLILTAYEYTTTFDSAVILIKSSSLPAEELHTQLTLIANLSDAHLDSLLGLIEQIHTNKTGSTTTEAY